MLLIDGELFPNSQSFFVNPNEKLSNILEGQFRKDFFIGVCTIVLKLLNCVRPKFAIFGKKDFQQALIIQQMCVQFNIFTEIILGDTVRENSGLAVSPRNGRLNSQELAESVHLYKIMRGAADKILIISNVRALNREEIEKIEILALNELADRGWRPEYFTIREKKSLNVPVLDKNQITDELMILTAAWLGENRLIDNLDIT